jgi:hypothetical protein
MLPNEVSILGKFFYFSFSVLVYFTDIWYNLWPFGMFSPVFGKFYR